MITGLLIGFIGGIFGIFYRNCLKVKNMIFNPLYRILLKMTKMNKVMRFIAYPLGYCIYCSSTWITIFLSIIYLSTLYNIEWQDIVLILIPSMGMQHLVVLIGCRFLISGHPDLNTINDAK